MLIEVRAGMTNIVDTDWIVTRLTGKANSMIYSWRFEQHTGKIMRGVDPLTLRKPLR